MLAVNSSSSQSTEINIDVKSCVIWHILNDLETNTGLINILMLQLGYVRKEQPIKQKSITSQLKAHKNITTVNSRTTNATLKIHENTNQIVREKCFYFFLVLLRMSRDLKKELQCFS